MRISELSRRSGVSVATIKYYRREGLLPEGRVLNPTAVEYGEEHLQRLRLIRGLIQFGGLSVARAREVLDAVDRPLDAFHTLGVVHHALPVPSVDSGTRSAKDDEAPGPNGAESVMPGEESEARVDALIEAMGWQISHQSPHRPALAESIAQLGRLGADYRTGDLIPYAQLATSAADLDFAQLDGIEDRIALAERAVILTVLFEPILELLRRLAQEDANHRRRAVERSSLRPAD